MEMRIGLILLALVGAAGLQSGSVMADPAPSAGVYYTDAVPQFQKPRLPDVTPEAPEARRQWAEALSFDAVLYGTASVLQYAQMHEQAVNSAAPGYTGFNRFAHGRSLAEPGYAAFKSPNADTLYSNAWLDLSNGPVMFMVPDTHGRYYTSNFIDMYANSTNIGARTHGTTGGRYLIAPANWVGVVPEGVTLFRVATPYVWVLLRILVDDRADMKIANKLQDQFIIAPLNTVKASEASRDFPPADTTSAEGFFRILDFVVKTNGFPIQEEALVSRYRGIGIAGNTSISDALADEVVADAMKAGFTEANKVIASALSQGGRTVNGWRESGDKGRYGSNYLYRSVINTLGTGSNVSDESTSFTTFTDNRGELLDGAKGNYQLILSPPPPARFFWSVTVYDAQTKELHPNPIKRYRISDRTKGLRRGANGEVVIDLWPKLPPKKRSSNWLPVPKGRFYLGIRAYGPEADVINGVWKPNRVQFVVE